MRQRELTRRGAQSPLLVWAVDPDSVSSAIVSAVRVDDRYELRQVFGGGASTVNKRPQPGPLQSIKPARQWLFQSATKLLGSWQPARSVLVVETQAAHGKWSHDVEPLRRVRYHLDALSELEGIVCEHVPPGQWEPWYGDTLVRGSIKHACQKRAKRELGNRRSNADQRDALGILTWYVEAKLQSKLVLAL